MHLFFVRSFHLLILVSAASLLQGCAALLIGGAAAGATYGTVRYVNNTLKVSHNVPLDSVWDAVNASIKELGLPILSVKKDGTGGMIKARTAAGQPVSVQAVRLAERATEVQISVGTFDSAPNRAIAQQIHDKIKAQL